MILRRNRQGNRLKKLPILVLMAHENCNCRCVMCDIWRVGAAGQALLPVQLERHIKSMKQLGVEQVVISGGEPLLNRSLWQLSEAIKLEVGAKITLLSTGLLLKRWAPEICKWCDEIIISLDGDENVHNAIRRVPNAFQKMKMGIEAIRQESTEIAVSGRCVIQKQNHELLGDIVEAASFLGLDSISFLAADLTSEAFNRPAAWSDEKVETIALSPEEADELELAIRQLADEKPEYFKTGFIAESLEKLLRIPDYYRAHHGVRPFPTVSCNAPWVSAVLEVDGTLRPCFFHEGYPDDPSSDFGKVINSDSAIAWRNELDVSRNEICQRCVCSINLG